MLAWQDHLDELRERVLVGALAAAVAVLTCFAVSKDLVVFLEAPVASQGVRFLQLSPGEFFFTTLKARSLHHWIRTDCVAMSMLIVLEAPIAGVRHSWSTRPASRLAMLNTMLKARPLFMLL